MWLAIKQATAYIGKLSFYTESGYRYFFLWLNKHLTFLVLFNLFLPLKHQSIDARPTEASMVDSHICFFTALLSYIISQSQCPYTYACSTLPDFNSISKLDMPLALPPLILLV